MLIFYIYALLVIDQGSGSTPKGPSQTPKQWDGP